MKLAELVHELREYRGVVRKGPIAQVAMRLIPLQSEDILAAYGEDAAVIKCGREILLMAADGIIQDLVKKNPYWAGYSAVLVNINDIAAMGGQPLADPIAAIVVATIIAVNAVRLFRENLSFLVGRSPGTEFMEKVTALGRSIPGVVDVHNIRAEYIGPNRLHAELHIRVPRGLLIEEADRIAGEVRTRVYQTTNCRYCTIHVDAVKAAAASTAEKKP